MNSSKFWVNYLGPIDKTCNLGNYDTQQVSGTINKEQVTQHMLWEIQKLHVIN